MQEVVGSPGQSSELKRLLVFGSLTSCHGGNPLMLEALLQC